MKIDYCNICDGKCDGVHSIKKSNKEKEIKKIVSILESYDEETVNKIITQIYQNRLSKAMKTQSW